MAGAEAQRPPHGKRTFSRSPQHLSIVSKPSQIRDVLVEGSTGIIVALIRTYKNFKGDD